MADKAKKELIVKDDEIELIKATFADNQYLLKALRALFCGLGVNTEEKNLIKTVFANEKLRALMRKRFLPEVSKDTPIGQVTDKWMGVETQIFGVNRETIFQSLMSKQETIDMVEKALGLLENPDGEQFDVSYNPKLNMADEFGIKLLARNHYLRHIETQLTFLMTIAGQKEETIEQAKKRMQVDSNE